MSPLLLDLLVAGLLAGAPGAAPPGALARTPERLVGYWHGSTQGASTVIEIEADGRCRYSHQASGPATEGEGRLVPDAGGTYRCRNAPGPVRLDLVAPPTRDPRIALTLSALTTQGWYSEGLALRLGGHLLPFDDDGRAVLLRDADLGGAREIAILRLADKRELWRTTLAPGGPNRFLFTYRPSNVEPVDVRFRPLDASAERLLVEVGNGERQVRRMRFTR